MTDEPISDDELRQRFPTLFEFSLDDLHYLADRIARGAHDGNPVEYTDVEAVSEAIGLHWTTEADDAWAARVTDGTIVGTICRRPGATQDRYEIRGPLLTRKTSRATLKRAQSALAGAICHRLEHPDSPYT